MKLVYATETGKKVAQSGLLPNTASFFLTYLAARADELVAMIPDETEAGGDLEGLNFCLLSAALMSPEFHGNSQTRFIPFGFGSPGKTGKLFSRMAKVCAGQPAQAYRSGGNAADLLVQWIEGASHRQLESQYQAVQAGTIQALCRDTIWCLSGLADIVAAATRRNTPAEERPASLQSATADNLRAIRRLIPSIRLLSWRLAVGLPATVLWLVETVEANGKPTVSRNEALALYQHNLGRYEVIRGRNNWEEIVQVLKEAGAKAPHERARAIQQLANDWHVSQRQRLKERQLKRSIEPLRSALMKLHECLQSDFERAFEECLQAIGLKFTRFDKPPKQSAFDYLLHFDEQTDLVFELKSKQGNSLVGLNESVEILASSEMHGHKECHCVTLCQPGVDPNVIQQISKADRLTVVETHELADVFCRIADASASFDDLYAWLSQPGWARLEDFRTTAVKPEIPAGPKDIAS